MDEKIIDEESFAVQEMRAQIMATKERYEKLLESGKIKDEKR
jgi:hypothetical protein